MSIRLVNPMNEAVTQASIPPPRLTSLAGKTIALLDISKSGGSMFLDRVEELLKDRYGVSAITRFTKPTFAKPAPEAIIQKIRGADAVIEGLAD